MVEDDTQHSRELTSMEREALMLAGPTHVRILVKRLKNQRAELDRLWGLHPEGKPTEPDWLDEEEGETTDVLP